MAISFWNQHCLPVYLNRVSCAEMRFPAQSRAGDPPFGTGTQCFCQKVALHPAAELVTDTGDEGRGEEKREQRDSMQETVVH